MRTEEHRNAMQSGHIIDSNQFGLNGTTFGEDMVCRGQPVLAEKEVECRSVGGNEGWTQCSNESSLASGGTSTEEKLIGV